MKKEEEARASLPRKGKRAGTIVLVALLYIGVWQFASWKIGQALFLPSPRAVLQALFVLLQESSFWRCIAMSLGRIMLGYGIGVTFGIVCAVGTARFPLVGTFLSPALQIIRATPVASFILLALLWLPTGRVPVLTASFMVLPVVYGPLLSALRHVDPQLKEMLGFYRVPSWTRFRVLTWPSVAPQLASACITAEGLAWKAGIAAEVLSTPLLSIGKGIYDSKIYLEIPELFAWTLAVIVLSLILEILVKKLFTMMIPVANRQEKSAL